MNYEESIYIHNCQNKILPKTFETYIPLKSNNTALNRCKTISEEINKSKKITSPLLIASECGIGKSHLLQSIHSEVIHRNVVLFYAEAFHHYQRKNKLKEFYWFLASHDILLIDDLHFLLDRLSPSYIQEEVIHYVIKLLNRFYQNNKPIIATTCFRDHSNTTDQKLESVLKELPFFNANEVVINNMSYDEKVIFLHQKRKDIGSELLPDSKIIEIAKKTTDTQDLIGTLQRIIAINRKIQLG